MKKYIPSKGDLIALSFNPQSGHEQKGRRPALVVSNTLFNQKTGLAIVCPITRTDRKCPFLFHPHPNPPPLSACDAQAGIKGEGQL